MDSTKEDCIPGTEHIASMGEENRKHQMLKYKITVCYIENKAKWCDRVIALYWVSSKPSLSTHVSLDFHEKKKKPIMGRSGEKTRSFLQIFLENGQRGQTLALTCIRLWNHFTTPEGRKSPIIIPAQLDGDSKGIKLL